MSADLVKRVSRYQEKIRKETGAEITFAVAVRALIERGLNEVGLKKERLDGDQQG